MFVTTLAGHHTHTHTHIHTHTHTHTHIHTPSHICTQCVITKGSVVRANVHKTPTFTNTESHTHTHTHTHTSVTHISHTHQSHTYTATQVTCFTTRISYSNHYCCSSYYRYSQLYTLVHSLTSSQATQTTTVLCTPGHWTLRVHTHTHTHTHTLCSQTLKRQL